MTMLLGTNVVSELIRKSLDPAVEAWADGRRIAPPDCQIAAIARSRKMAVATRNDRDFENINIEVINLWSAA